MKIKPRWWLVGNIIHETKYFSKGAKVYCFPIIWYDDYTQVRIVGLHRVSKRLIEVTMSTKNIKNWRVQEVYKQQVLKVLEDAEWRDKEAIERTVIRLRGR